MRLIDADAFIAKLDHVPMIQEAIKKAMDTMPTIELKEQQVDLINTQLYVDGFNDGYAAANSKKVNIKGTIMLIKKYIKKPIPVEALQWTGENEKEIQEFCGEAAWLSSERELGILTLEGLMVATKGDYIIKGVDGEFYPCKEDIFNKTYEEYIS